MADPAEQPDQLGDRVLAMVPLERQLGLVLRLDIGQHGLAAGELLPVVQMDEIRGVDDEQPAGHEHAIERVEKGARRARHVLDDAHAQHDVVARVEPGKPVPDVAEVEKLHSRRPRAARLGPSKACS